MKLNNKKIAFLGAGKMAEALIRGLISSRTLFAKNIFVSDVSPLRLKHLTLRYKVRAAKDNLTAAASCDIVVLSVKPQVIHDVLCEIGRHLRRDQIVISIAAGIQVKSIKKEIKRSKIVRAMPNNPALIGEGITAISKNAPAGALKVAELLFSSVGEVIFISEDLMDAVTALSGSGPGFIYYFAEALIEGGVAAGLSHSDSGVLAAQTILGSAKALKISGRSPRDLRAMVTSPGGTTLAGLKVLEKNKFKNAVVSAIMAAAKRSSELGATLSR